MLLSLAELVADGTDLSDADVEADLQAMGMDGRRIASAGAARVRALLDRQRLGWQSASRVRVARAVATRAPRVGGARPRAELLAAVKDRQRTGTRVDWHKLEGLTDDQLEGLLADDDMASALDRLADSEQG
ncbi:MAG: hypothetical protein ACOZNI_30385 [Myxococcota bacterium]